MKPWTDNQLAATREDSNCPDMQFTREEIESTADTATAGAPSMATSTTQRAYHSGLLKETRHC